MSGNSLKVGDIKLFTDYTGGRVVVYRDGEKLGSITAQGLHEAAQLDDEDLFDCWREEAADD